jgi:hypothetical protein
MPAAGDLSTSTLNIGEVGVGLGLEDRLRRYYGEAVSVFLVVSKNQRPSAGLEENTRMSGWFD